MEELKITMRAARYNSGKTQKELAAAVGVSDYTIRHWEQGITAPDIEQFKKFCDAVGIDPGHIIFAKKSRLN